MHLWQQLGKRLWEICTRRGRYMTSHGRYFMQVNAELSNCRPTMLPILIHSRDLQWDGFWSGSYCCRLPCLMILLNFIHCMVCSVAWCSSVKCHWWPRILRQWLLRSLHFAPITFAILEDWTPNLTMILITTNYYTPYPRYHPWPRPSHSLMAVHLMAASCLPHAKPFTMHITQPCI